MADWKTLSHVKWECKYHLIMVPKYRKRVIYGQLRREISERPRCSVEGAFSTEGG